MEIILGLIILAIIGVFAIACMIENYEDKKYGKD